MGFELEIGEKYCEMVGSFALEVAEDGAESERHVFPSFVIEIWVLFCVIRTMWLEIWWKRRGGGKSKILKMEVNALHASCLP